MTVGVYNLKPKWELVIIIILYVRVTSLQVSGESMRTFISHTFDKKANLWSSLQEGRPSGGAAFERFGLQEKKMQTRNINTCIRIY